VADGLASAVGVLELGRGVIVGLTSAVGVLEQEGRPTATSKASVSITPQNIDRRGFFIKLINRFLLMVYFTSN
jgi:hypothetical protein